MSERKIDTPSALELRLYNAPSVNCDSCMEASSSKLAEQAAKELGITQVVPMIYQDVLQPAAREVGQKLVVVAKAVSIALAPLEFSTWGYEQIKGFLLAKVAAKLAHRSADQIKPPDRNIAGPVVMALAFAAEAPHLREMYANLLATAMHAPSAERVHPSFVQVIQQLAPAEAQIVQEIARKHKSGSVLFSEKVATLGTAAHEPRLARYFETSGPITSQWHQFCRECGVTESAPIEAFYMNLIRLGILAESIDSKGAHRIGLRIENKQQRLFRSVQLTEYGDLFLSVCVREIT